MSMEIFSFVWYVCSEIAYMGSISSPEPPNEWKLRGKAPQGLRRPPEHKKFDYS